MAKRKIKREKVVAGIKNQPISSVVWVDRNSLRANSYNPNHVFPPELELLKTSILEDGWTQPIVARSDGEIVDGFHRWLIADDPEIAQMTGGQVPVVMFDKDIPMDHQMMSTIRHNRARGSHAAMRMADLVVSLIDDQKVDVVKVMDLLQMDREEIDRLYDHGNMRKRGAVVDFSKSWIPGKRREGFDRKKGTT
jgi:ParB-like chromosome segregation protein Spo0J